MTRKYKNIIKKKERLAYRADETVFEANEARINQVIEWIKALLYKNNDMIALSAPQIGVNMRLFCMKFNGGDIRTFINPIISKNNRQLVTSIEKNASVKGEYLNLRYDRIDVIYQTPTAKIETNTMTSFPGYIFQQMMDCIDGLYIDDLGLEIISDYYTASEEERQELINAWIDERKKKKIEIDKEIDENPELKEIDDAIDFMTGVATGKIETELKDDKQANH